MRCPLCSSLSIKVLRQVNDRPYFQCRKCVLIFLDPAFRLNKVEEKAIYDYHQNDPDDPDYRAFVSALFDPLVKLLAPGSSGLEFGCGSGSALSAMLDEAGFKVAEYDPIYRPDEACLQQNYDFITATEVFEHIFEPGEVLRLLTPRLNKGGILGIMTSLYQHGMNFAQWHYIRDPTHVCFYSGRTFEWIASQYSAKLKIVRHRVVLLQF